MMVIVMVRRYDTSGHAFILSLVVQGGMVHVVLYSSIGAIYL